MICKEIVGKSRLSNYRANINRALKLEAEIADLYSNTNDIKEILMRGANK